MENTAKVKVYNLIILDKSGSMSTIENAAIAGFNETVGGIRSAQEQFSQSQEHFVSLLTFCTCRRNYVYDCVPVAKVKNLTSHDYSPCCGTPLYDAIGMGVNDLFKKTKDMKDATVIVTVITDGMENASREYSGAAISALIKKMRDEYGWNFAYIGTNQDVESVAHSISITHTMYFEDTQDGMGAAWDKERKARQRMYSNMDEAYLCCEASAPVEEKVAYMNRRMSAQKKYREMGEFAHRVTPQRINALKPGQVFVFGSDGKGSHTGGAAFLAVQRFGAIVGQSEGLQGNSYAIDTMDGLEVLKEQAVRLATFAKEHPELTFLVTALGCGVAGHTPRQVAPLFSRAVDVENIWLPQEFWNELV